MAKIVGGKFTVSWTPSPTPDVVSVILFFASSQIGITYDSPSQEIPVEKNSFAFPADASAGFVPPTTADKTYVALAAKDSAGNLSDMTGAITVPFDTTPPSPPLNPRLV